MYSVDIINICTIVKKSGEWGGSFCTRYCTQSFLKHRNLMVYTGPFWSIMLCNSVIVVNIQRHIESCCISL